VVKDKQVRELMKMLQEGKTLQTAALKTGMDEKTARKWRDSKLMPSECKKERTWKTRIDPFENYWAKIKPKLELNPGLEAKTLFEYLKKRYPDKFFDSQLRTLQRKIKRWKAIYGPGKEVFFDQVHYPGDLCQSDFTNMNKLNITICGAAYDHLLYHFVLTYSNWEAGFVCYSESFEALSQGLQDALFKLGKIPSKHRTDSLSAAVKNIGSKKEFTQRYQALLSHYNLDGFKINPGKANEDGDIEQRNNRFKRALDQALMLRGSRDFLNIEEYAAFLEQLFKQLNNGRKKHLDEELKVMKPLPKLPLDAFRRLEASVSKASTIRVLKNVYSAHSRLIGQEVKVLVYAGYLEIFYAQKLIETLPRLRGEGRHRINYRHIIDWLVRKPGAFENYRYKSDLFPTSRFRMAFDGLTERNKQSANKNYLKILELAAKEGEQKIDDALRLLINQGLAATKEGVLEVLNKDEKPAITSIVIPQIELTNYDQLLSGAIA
jgi:hypothetical protein